MCMLKSCWFGLPDKRFCGKKKKKKKKKQTLIYIATLLVKGSMPYIMVIIQYGISDQNSNSGLGFLYIVLQ